MLQNKLAMASLVTLVLGTMTAFGAELIGVPGSAARYATPIEVEVGDQTVPMTLTGVAMRKKLVFNVYAIGSYLQQGVTVKSAEELAATDSAKMLHLVMESDLSGKSLADAFQEAIRLNYAAPAFEQEIKTLADVLKSRSIKKGDQFQMIHIPGVGVDFVLNGKSEVVIRNVAFGKAVWDIYLGPKNLGTEIKAGLSLRL